MIAGRWWLDALTVAVPLLVCAACGSDATGVDTCKRIEEARCRRAPGCRIQLEPPYFTSGNAVDACIRFYDTACLHGLEASDPGPVVVSACVDAISNPATACSVVASPQTDPKCAWLVPSSTPSDASDAVGNATDAANQGMD